MLDNQLTRRLIGDAERNRYNDEVGYRSPGNPNAELWDMFETEPWSSTFPNYGTFRSYYEQQVEPQMLQTRRNMMEYLRDHPDRDIVTSYGWLNGDYPDQEEYEN